MTGFWGVTKWGQTRDKQNRDVTKFLACARNRTTTRFMRVDILSHFCPRCDKFCHNSLIHQSKCHISYRNDIFVPSLSHLIWLWQMLSNVCPQFVTSYICYDKFCPILSPVCHISPMLWQILSNFCPGLSHFLDFYTFFMHKMYILAFCHSFVPFFVTWDKFCHIFNTLETQ